MSVEALGPAQLIAAMVAYRDALAADQSTINRLNVFPVPDGDTGTNMLLTVESVVLALVELSGNQSDAGDGGDADPTGAGADMAQVAAAIGRAALMERGATPA